MKQFKVDTTQEIPIIPVLLQGPLGSKVVRLVFDTGCGLTQINTPVIEALGYSAVDAQEMVTAIGPAGPIQTGYSLNLSRLLVLGTKFESVKVAAYDFDFAADFSADGLLGFDLIKQFHLEMNGPKGLLSIYGENGV